ncbi:trimethylamine methyltransferase family protein [Chloroflexota bacterium]
MLRGFVRKSKPHQLLSEEEVHHIHKAVLDILSETGVTINSKQALEDLGGNGCRIDFDSNRVRFPEYLVEEAIRVTPSSHRIKARDPQNDLILGGDTVYFQNFPGMQTVDLDTWEPRDASMQEYIDLITILDALPNVHNMSCYPYYGYEGVPPVMRIPEGIALKIRHSTKVQAMCNARDVDQFNIRMIKATGGDAILSLCGSAPLTWYDDQIRAAYRAINSGFPVYIMQGTVSGATGPATIIGSAIVNLAEELAMLVLLQILAPGTRVQIGSFTQPQNMASGVAGFGRISCSLIKAVENQMLRKYRIPTLDNSAGVTSSKMPDFQVGYEKAIATLNGALTGSNIIQLHSGIYGEMTCHPIQAVLDDDIAGMIGRYIEGVTVCDETIALELIEEVGPIPGQYLNTAHTREWWKREQFIPKSADSLTYPEWIAVDKKHCLDYAKERMEEILKKHSVSVALTASQEQEIRKILTEAREYYREKGFISDEEWKVYEKKVLNSSDYPFA